MQSDGAAGWQHTSAPRSGRHSNFDVSDHLPQSFSYPTPCGTVKLLSWNISGRCIGRPLYSTTGLRKPENADDYRERLCSIALAVGKFLKAARLVFPIAALQDCPTAEHDQAGFLQALRETTGKLGCDHCTRQVSKGFVCITIWPKHLWYRRIPPGGSDPVPAALRRSLYSHLVSQTGKQAPDMQVLNVQLAGPRGPPDPEYDGRVDHIGAGIVHLLQQCGDVVLVGDFCAWPPDVAQVVSRIIVGIECQAIPETSRTKGQPPWRPSRAIWSLRHCLLTPCEHTGQERWQWTRGTA